MLSTITNLSHRSHPSPLGLTKSPRKGNICNWGSKFPVNERTVLQWVPQASVKAGAFPPQEIVADSQACFVLEGMIVLDKISGFQRTTLLGLCILLSLIKWASHRNKPPPAFIGAETRDDYLCLCVCTLVHKTFCCGRCSIWEFIHSFC
jgi:hypothetical protein